MPLPRRRRQPVGTGWRHASAYLTTRFAWRTWSPLPLLRPPAFGGGAVRLLRRDGATDRL